MDESQKKLGEPPRIKDLYPELAGEDLRIAEENLARYLRHTLENYEWIRRDPERYARLLSLTAEREAASVRESQSVSKPIQKFS